MTTQVPLRSGQEQLSGVADEPRPESYHPSRLTMPMEARIESPSKGKPNRMSVDRIQTMGGSLPEGVATGEESLRELYQGNLATRVGRAIDGLMERIEQMLPQPKPIPYAQIAARLDRLVAENRAPSGVALTPAAALDRFNRVQDTVLTVMEAERSPFGTMLAGFKKPNMVEAAQGLPFAASDQPQGNRVNADASRAATQATPPL